jgi:superfamily II DNA or RNA helicase
MGTGKTFLFAEIAKALWLPTIVLVPRIGLVNDTKEEMVGSDKKLWVWFKDEEVYTISSKATWTSAEQLQKIFDVNDGKFDGVLVTTYASLNSLRRSSPELFGILIECCGFIVSDEAHRSLWEQTKEAGDELFAWEIWNDAEKAERELEEVLEESFKWKVHLFTTATPRLIDKDVRDDNDTIYSATIQEVADSWDLIIPKRVSVWKSFLHIERSNEEDQRFRLSEADLSWPLDKYRDIDWNPLYETLSNKYVEEKEKAGGYLPWVWFCTTVDQAEFVTKHLNSIWVRAVRCTSDKPWVSKSVSDTEAKRMLENNEVDVVVTCTKVWEGWDVPTLRSAIWYTPTQSPVKNLQGNGRIMRTISEHLADIYRKAMWLAYKEKNQDNTMIIEPESWEVVAFDWDMVDMDRDWGWWWEKIEWVWSLKTISGSHEMMYDVWELEKGYLDGEGIELVKKYDETETMSEEELIEFHKQQLEELWIIGMEWLIRFWPTEYRNQFGKMIAWRILWDIPNSITVSVLHSMWISLWFEEMLLEGNLNRDELIKKHKSDLENIWINNAFELIDFGSVKYIRNFGRYPIWKILWRVIDSINKEILQELWELLFWIQEDKTIENHKIKLAELWILNNDDLLSFWAKKYQKRFWVTIAWKILGESTRLVTKERLYDIWIAIWFWEVFMIEKLSIEELTKKHKVDLTNIWIQDTYSLVNFSPRDYRDKFWLAIIWKILWQSTTTITIEKLQELWELIFWIQEDKTIENYKLELESFGIYNNNTLLDFWVNAFRDKIWVLVAWKILWQSIGRITIEILQELWEILFWSLKEETIKIHKNELRWLEITDFEWLLKLWVVKYKKSFWKISIIRILGYSPDIIKKDNLKELWEAIFWIQEDTTLKDHKEKLSLLGIQNTKQLIEFGPTNYRGKFGNAVAWKVLWYPLKSINKNIIKELWEALFPEDKK